MLLLLLLLLQLLSSEIYTKMTLRLSLLLTLLPCFLDLLWFLKFLPRLPVLAGAPYRARGVVGAGGGALVVVGRTGRGLAGSSYTYPGVVITGSAAAALSTRGAPSQVLAQPSKQQSPLFGQSVSLWPGDQQVDTAPAHSASERGEAAGH